MEKFCVITNIGKDKEYQTAGIIDKYLKEQGRYCVIIEACKREEDGFRRYTDAEVIPKDVECAIVLGGDGTMIQSANDLVNRDIPILGINLGTLGFLTTIEKQSMITSLKQIINGDYQIESRMMLECNTFSIGDQKNISGPDPIYHGYALNDFVIGKQDFGRLITIQIYINAEHLDTYSADGMVISTPTGSTAYNLSAGGPVLAPEMRAVVITPICPHSLNKRSLVVSSEDKLVMKVGQSKEMICDKASLVADGREVAELKTNDYVEIGMASKDTKIVKLKEVSFYERMRSKLNS